MAAGASKQWRKIYREKEMKTSQDEVMKMEIRNAERSCFVVVIILLIHKKSTKRNDINHIYSCLKIQL